MQAIFHQIGRPIGGRKVYAQMGSVAVFLLLALALAGCGASSQPAPVPTPVPQAQQPAVAPTESAVGVEPTQPAAATTPRATEPSAQPEAQPTEAPAVTEVSPTAAPPSEPTPVVEPAATAPLEPASADDAVTICCADFVIGEGSEATFTVNEKLAWLDLPNDAVMRTEGLAGGIFLERQLAVFELDLHSMTSDSDRRDGYVRNRMFPDHPTATFTVLDWSHLPDPLPLGEVVTGQIQGELSIKGVTKPLTFEVEVRQDPAKLFVLGRTTFTWDDLELPPPNIPGRIQVKDEVRVEVLLSAVPGEAAAQ